MKKRRATAIAPVDNASAPEPSTLLLECGVEQSSRADISKDEHATSSSGKAAKRRKLFAAQQLEGGLRAIVTPQALPAHPFVADPHDHAETPFEAYQDIEPILFRLATLLGRTKAGATALRLYDPFYCAGSVKRHLGRLGFDSVRNDNVDFYNYSNRPTPGDFDVLISNPPFSGDHMPRTVTYAVECGRPWLLLMPDFVAKKTWFKQLIGSTPAAPGALPVQRQRLYYLGPATTPYTFAAPGRDGADGGGAPLVPRSHESSLPFQVFACKFSCIWYLSLGAEAETIVPWWRRKYEGVTRCMLANTAAELPQLVPPPPPAARPKRPWRKKLSRQRKLQKAEARS